MQMLNAIIKILLKGKTRWGTISHPPDRKAGVRTAVRSPKSVLAIWTRTRLTPQVPSRLSRGLEYRNLIMRRSMINPKKPATKNDKGRESQKNKSESLGKIF